jgi:ArsR family transcriptional regulator
MSQQELCVCELMNAIDEHQPKVSRHLAQLLSCELLTDRHQGQWAFDHIRQNIPDWAFTVLSETLASNAAFIADDLIRHSCMGDR